MATYTGDCGENVTYSFNTSTGRLTISGTGPMTDYTHTTGDHSPFTVFSDNDWSEDIEEVVIESGVTYIGNNAFKQSYLTSVTLPDTLTSIGDWAFMSGYLTSIRIPNSVTSMGNGAFYGCDKLVSATIGDGLTEIPSQAFYNCTALTSIVIGSGVANVNYYAFKGCSAVTDIKFKGGQPTFNSGYTNTLAFDLGTSSSPVTATVYSSGWASDAVFTTSIRGNYTTFTYEPLPTCTVRVNVNGTWSESAPYVNVSGTWKEVVGVYVNVSGTWKEVV